MGNVLQCCTSRSPKPADELPAGLDQDTKEFSRSASAAALRAQQSSQDTLPAAGAVDASEDAAAHPDEGKAEESATTGVAEVLEWEGHDDLDDAARTTSPAVGSNRSEPDTLCEGQQVAQIRMFSDQSASLSTRSSSPTPRSVENANQITVKTFRQRKLVPNSNVHVTSKTIAPGQAPAGPANATTIPTTTTQSLTVSPHAVRISSAPSAATTYVAPVTVAPVQYMVPTAATYGTPPMQYRAPVQQASQHASIFDQLDTNHDGVVTRAEFAKMIR